MWDCRESKLVSQLSLENRLLTSDRNTSTIKMKEWLLICVDLSLNQWSENIIPYQVFSLLWPGSTHCSARVVVLSHFLLKWEPFLYLFIVSTNKSTRVSAALKLSCSNSKILVRYFISAEALVNVIKKGNWIVLSAWACAQLCPFHTWQRHHYMHALLGGFWGEGHTSAGFVHFPVKVLQHQDVPLLHM